MAVSTTQIGIVLLLVFIIVISVLHRRGRYDGYANEPERVEPGVSCTRSTSEGKGPSECQSGCCFSGSCVAASNCGGYYGLGSVAQPAKPIFPGIPKPTYPNMMTQRPAAPSITPSQQSVDWAKQFTDTQFTTAQYETMPQPRFDFATGTFSYPTPAPSYPTPAPSYPTPAPSYKMKEGGSCSNADSCETGCCLNGTCQSSWKCVLGAGARVSGAGIQNELDAIMGAGRGFAKRN